jgi:hypothetical protein
VKAVVGYVVAGGTALVVKGFIDNNTNPETMPSKIMVAAASVAIGGIAKDATRKYTDEQIDKLIAAWNDAKEAVRSLKEA